MRDEELSFYAEASHRDSIAKLWSKIRKPRQGIERICQIKGIATRHGEKAVWHFPSRKRYFRIDQDSPNNWNYDS